MKTLPTFYSAFLSFEHDEFEAIDLRTIFSPSVGHVFADEEKKKLRGEIGPSVQHEYRRKPQQADFVGEDDPAKSYADALASWDESVWTPQLRIKGLGKIGVFDDATISEDIEWYPGYQGGYVYRVVSVTTFEQPLSETWALKFLVIYQYNSDVQSGIDPHDLKLVLTLGIKL